jgi:hypothetical protein
MAALLWREVVQLFFLKVAPQHQAIVPSYIYAKPDTVIFNATSLALSLTFQPLLDPNFQVNISGRHTLKFRAVQGEGMTLPEGYQKALSGIRIPFVFWSCSQAHHNQKYVAQS